MFQNVQKCLKMNIFSGAFMVQTRFVIRIMGILVRIWCKKNTSGKLPLGQNVLTNIEVNNLNGVLKFL